MDVEFRKHKVKDHIASLSKEEGKLQHPKLPEETFKGEHTEKEIELICFSGGALVNGDEVVRPATEADRLQYPEAYAAFKAEPPKPCPACDGTGLAKPKAPEAPPAASA